jgi:hypothetical protein
MNGAKGGVLAVISRDYCVENMLLLLKLLHEFFAFILKLLFGNYSFRSKFGYFA